MYLPPFEEEYSVIQRPSSWYSLVGPVTTSPVVGSVQDTVIGFMLSQPPAIGP